MTLNLLLLFIALILAIISLFEARYRLLTVAVILLITAELIGSAGGIHLGLIGQ